jgi:sugar phosphate isomerase/epimerase
LAVQFCMDPATIGFDITLEEYIIAAAQGGFRAVEWPVIWAREQTLKGSAAAAREIFRAYGVEPLQFTSGFGVPGNLAVPHDLFEHLLVEFDQNCSIARAVGAIRGSAFFDMVKHNGISLSTQEIVDRVQQVTSVAARHGIRMVIGWHDPSLLAVAGAIYEEADKAFGLLVDAFTMYRAGFGSELIRTLAEGAVGWVRVGDAPEGCERRRLAYESRLLPGSGVIPIRSIVDACFCNGYSGPISIETRDPSLNGLTPGERAAAAYRSMEEYFA